MPPESNADWFFDHYTQVLAEYGALWVAVSGGRILAAGEDAARVLGEARRKVNWAAVPVLLTRADPDFQRPAVF